MTTIVRGDIRPLDFDPEFDDESDSVALLSSIDGQGRPLLGAPEKRSQGIRSSDSQEPAPLGVAHAEKRFWFQRGAEYDADAIATLPSVFDNPETAREYHPRDDWENIHRFDPTARWTWREEHALIRKIDLKIMIFACIMFMALELDRANILQALTDNFLEDLNLTTNDYNLGNAVFKLSFLCAEVPSQLASKWIGPDRWIPAQMSIWSIVAATQFKLSGRTSFLLTRSLLGLLQGGFIPDVILYLSYFYKHHELSLRMGFFWMAMSFADILAGFFAYGLLHMRGVDGHAGWRWMFLIEAIFTLLIGILAFGLMPASPTHTSSWFRGRKGWFNEREEVIMINRVIREDPSKGGMHNRQPITPALLWKCLKDYDLWPLYILGLTFQIPMTPPHQYLTLSLRGLGFDTFQSNLLAIPWTFIHISTMMFITYLAEIKGELTFIAWLGQLWALPFLIYFNVVDTTKVNRWVIWFITTVFLGYPSAHPIQVGWNSRNSNSVRTRTVSAAMYNMFVQAGGVISANIYQEDDGPRYAHGNRILLIMVFVNIGLYLFTKAYYKYRNKQRDRRWHSMSEQQQLGYLARTKDEGNKRLDFRFAH